MKQSEKWRFKIFDYASDLRNQKKLISFPLPWLFRHWTKT